MITTRFGGRMAKRQQRFRKQKKARERHRRCKFTEKTEIFKPPIWKIWKSEQRGTADSSLRDDTILSEVKLCPNSIDYCTVTQCSNFFNALTPYNRHKISRQTAPFTFLLFCLLTFNPL